MVHDELGTCILNRSLDVGRMGIYWGFADWLCWGFTTRTVVYFIIGVQCLNGFLTFCGPAAGAQCQIATQWSDPSYFLQKLTVVAAVLGDVHAKVARSAL